MIVSGEQQRSTWRVLLVTSAVPLASALSVKMLGFWESFPHSVLAYWPQQSSSLFRPVGEYLQGLELVSRAAAE